MTRSAISGQSTRRSESLVGHTASQSSLVAHRRSHAAAETLCHEG